MSLGGVPSFYIVTLFKFYKILYWFYFVMLSKVLQPCRGHVAHLLALRTPQKISVRRMWGIPPLQYHMAYPDKFRPGYAMRVYWELIPVFVTTGIAFGCLFFAIFWGLTNKVSVDILVTPDYQAYNNIYSKASGVQYEF